MTLVKVMCQKWQVLVLITRVPFKKFLLRYNVHVSRNKIGTIDLLSHLTFHYSPDRLAHFDFGEFHIFEITYYILCILISAKWPYWRNGGNISLVKL